MVVTVYIFRAPAYLARGDGWKLLAKALQKAMRLMAESPVLVPCHKLNYIRNSISLFWVENFERCSRFPQHTRYPVLTPEEGPEASVMLRATLQSAVQKAL